MVLPGPWHPESPVVTTGMGQNWVPLKWDG